MSEVHSFPQDRNALLTAEPFVLMDVSCLPVSTMEILPDEIIQHILTDPSLSIADVVSFSSACSKFREIVNLNGSLWRMKYFQRWPKTDIDIVCEDWRNEYISRKNFEKQVREVLSIMSSRFFHLDVKNIGGLQLNFVTELIDPHEYSYYYLRDFLIEVNSTPLTQSLTDKYYGNILLKYMHKNHCRQVWANLMKLNTKEQTLEKGAMFVTLWCQEYERGIWNTVATELDKTANLVKHHLFYHYKDHPLKYTSEESLQAWRNENIPGNMFEPDLCKPIIWAINYVLFEVLKFCIAYNSSDLDRKRSGIDCAFLDRKANPIVFAVIYESTARRLGVKIEILEFLDHCLLRWKENYSVECSLTHYVNTSADGIFIKSRCPRKSNNNAVITPCNMQQIAQRAALHIYPSMELRLGLEYGESHLFVRDTVELMLVITPFSLECYQQLSRSYMLHEVDARELILKIKDVKTQISDSDWRWFQPLLHSLELYQLTWDRTHAAAPTPNPPVRHRTEDVDFAVGMIVRDRLCERTGVIHGWSFGGNTFEASGKKAGRQVFYNVLADDGSYQFVPQEHLQILHSPPFVSYPSIGRFFDEYCTTFYRPNKELQAVYPQDMEALQKILKKDRQT